MNNVPKSVQRQIQNPLPDIGTFSNVLTGKIKPEKVYLAELFADPEVMQWITEDVIGKKWVSAPVDISNRSQIEAHLLCQIEYWYRMGYDYIRVNGGADFVDTSQKAKEPSSKMGRKERNWANMHSGPIQNFDDFEKYPWPEIKDENLWTYEFVADNLPEGMGLMACPSSGFLEIPTEAIIGYESLAMMIYDKPELVKAVFDKVRDILLGAYRKIVSIPKLVGFFQGDDMGFKTGTLFSPEFLKEYSLPSHKMAAELAHKHNKIYMLHSCGKLDEIIDYLIDEVKIDAKQSYEDVITPVEEFYSRFSNRVAVLGGLDVNLLAGADETTVRHRSREILDKCVPNGRYAFGSGNTITNYCKKENILAMFDEAFDWKLRK